MWHVELSDSDREGGAWRTPGSLLYERTHKRSRLCGSSAGRRPLAVSQLHLHLQLATPGTTSHALPVAQPIHGCSVDMDLPVYLSCVLERPILLTKDENHQGYQHYVCSHVFTCVRACVRACVRRYRTDGVLRLSAALLQPASQLRAKLCCHHSACAGVARCAATRGCAVWYRWWPNRGHGVEVSPASVAPPSILLCSCCTTLYM